MSDLDATTEVGRDPRRPRRSGDGAPQPALAVAWSADEPARLGEVLLVPGGAGCVLGRGGATLVRQRPGITEPTGPPRAPRLSRQQLRLQALGGGRIQVENVGRCGLRVRGEGVAQSIVGPGDVLRLGDELVLLCVLRPAVLPATRETIDGGFPWAAPDPHGVVGESPAAWALRDLVAFVGPRPGHVLVLGESGSGKELVARALHRCSARREQPFVARNAATIPDTLMAAELFGHARGYPNAGMPERPGLVGEADGGSLFLDEIGELPLALQAHLLRLMDGGEYQRLGEARTRAADVRLVAATNRPRDALKHDVLARFRHVIEVPPLADRPEDVPLLARHLLRRAAEADAALRARLFDEAGEPRLDPALVEGLLHHPLPGQVRTLDALLWRSLAHSRGATIEPADELHARPAPATAVDPQSVTAADLRAAMEAHGGVQEKVWRALGLSSRYVLRRLLEKHGLD